MNSCEKANHLVSIDFRRSFISVLDFIVFRFFSATQYDIVNNFLYVYFRQLHHWFPLRHSRSAISNMVSLYKITSFFLCGILYYYYHILLLSKQIGGNLYKKCKFNFVSFALFIFYWSKIILLKKVLSCLSLLIKLKDIISIQN